MSIYRLNESDRENYNKFLNALEKGMNSVSFNGNVEDQYILDILRMVMSENNHYMIAPNDVLISSTHNILNGTTSSVKFTPIVTKDIKRRKKEFEYIVDDILSRVPEGSDFAKAKFVYDYVIDNFSYEMGDSKLSHTLFGAVINKRAVCDGLSYLVSYLLNKLNIPSGIIVGGTSTSSLPHAWNIVKIGHGYYHIDITWPLMLKNRQYGRYNYFLLSDKEISLTHFWDKKYYPECRSNQYNHFIINDTYAYEKRHVLRILEEHIKEGKEHIYFKVAQFLNKDISENWIQKEFSKLLYKYHFNTYNFKTVIFKEFGIYEIYWSKF